MTNKLHKLMFYFMVLQIVARFTKIECKAASQAENGEVVGAGLLVGGTNVSNSVVNNPTAALEQASAVIEKGETLPNGCYKQTIKEPDQNDMTKFIATEQLICPQNATTQTVPTFVHLVPVVTIQQPYPATPAMHMIQIPILIKPAEPNDVIPNTPKEENVTSTTSTIVPPYTASLQPILPLQPNLTIPDQSNVNGMQPAQPLAPTLSVVDLPPQIIALSNTSGDYGQEMKKENAANRSFSHKFSFLLCIFMVISFL